VNHQWVRSTEAKVVKSSGSTGYRARR
jgi:hypothetical protein